MPLKSKNEMILQKKILRTHAQSDFARVEGVLEKIFIDSLLREKKKEKTKRKKKNERKRKIINKIEKIHNKEK